MSTTTDELLALMDGALDQPVDGQAAGASAQLDDSPAPAAPLPEPAHQPKAEKTAAPPAGAGAAAGSFDTLPVEEQTAILRQALKFGIREDDPIFQIIVALAWHLRLYQEMPAQVQAAGHQVAGRLAEVAGGASELMNATRQGVASDGKAHRDEIASILSKFMSEVRPAMATAATAGIHDGIKRLDSKAIVAGLAVEIERQTGPARAKRWFSIALGFAALVGFMALAAGFFVGRHVFPIVDPAAGVSGVSMAITGQLSCSTAGQRQGYMLCQSPETRTAVLVRSVQ